MATRALWKGAISFGLLHIPVALHSATTGSGLDFDWLDKRTMDPVGYKRINKATGEEIAPEDIIKGIEYEHGQYVVLTDDEIRAAYPKATQTIVIEHFASNTEIPFIYLDRPYYIEPVNKEEKGYALLRDALLQTQRVGVARVVIQNKQHLAALVPSGPGLILNLLRWGEDIRSWEELELPPEGPKAAGLSDKELSMAKQLVQDMSGPWNPHQYSDSFKDEILALVARKVEAGQLHTVVQPEEATKIAPAAPVPFGAQILDLTDLLERSLRREGSAPAQPPQDERPHGKAKTPPCPPTTEAGPSGKPPPRTPGKHRAA
ncbi:MAG: Ku protein [Pseudomonadota bacterium]|nr:Ku protein [Pseudomonadota bacterium]